MFLQNSASRGRRGIAGPATLLLILVTLLVLANERMASMESLYYDFLQRQQLSTPSQRILLIDTSDQSSSDDIWEASQFSPLVDALKTAGASLIVPIQAPPASTALPNMQQLTALAELEKRARQVGDAGNGTNASLADQLAEFRKQYDRQAEVASIVKDAGNIVLAISTHAAPQNSKAGETDCRQHTVRSNQDDQQKAPWVRESNSELTLPDTLCSSAISAGFAQFWPDGDGIVRRNHLLVKSGERVFPALSLAVAESDRSEKNLTVDGPYQISLDDQTIDTGPGFTSLIRYYGQGDQTFETISTTALLAGGEAAETVRDRIVVIGDLNAGAKGNYRTPFNAEMPAALLLATSLSNLLQMDYLHRPYWLASVELAVLILLGVTILFLAPRLRRNRAVILTVLLITLLMTTEAYLLIAHGIWMQLVTATLFATLGILSVQALSSLASAGTDGDARVNAVLHHTQLADEDELDLAFSVLRQQPATDETKNRLYDIAMTHGKRKEFAKAERVLLHLASIDADFRDVNDKLKLLSGARKKPEESKSTPTAGDEPASTHSATGPGQIMGRKLGRYRLERILGRGAMATVYLGVDPNINRKVAIKTMALAEEFSDADLDAAKIQFRREAESAGRLNHPNIIAIYDTGEDGNVAYLAMEYFEGKALNHYAQADNLLPPKWVLELTARAAEALNYAHGQNVVHRDIKPANLMYDAASDTLKITDFGIARLTDTSRTKTGIILGTPSYMSPEQLAASAVTGKSDLYSLGITMYQLLTGTTPFRSDSIPKLMDKIMNDKHNPVSSLRDDIPVDVDLVLDQVLAKQPEDRYPNGRAMALALRDCIRAMEN
jgi:CHASE2 domain-containing sensor protein/tRNA A-37 threonylcarbamoyl transferase component Bud32